MHSETDENILSLASLESSRIFENKDILNLVSLESS